MVARRVKKKTGPRRLGKKKPEAFGPVDKRPKKIPASLRLEVSDGKIGVNVYREDRDTPHSLAISFRIDRKTAHCGDMLICVYATLRETLRSLLPKPRHSEKPRGKHRSKPRRIPGK